MSGFVARLGEVVLRFFGAVFSALVMPFRLCFRRLRILFRRLAAAVRAAPSRDGAAPTPRRGAERAPSAARRPEGAPVPRSPLTLWLIALASVGICAVTAAHFLSLRPAIRVEAGGTLIGCAAEESDYLAARSAAEARIRCGGASFNGGLPEITFRLDHVSVSEYTPPEKLTENLLKNAGGRWVNACGVFVDGTFVGAALSEADAKAAFDGVLRRSEAAAGAGASCYFAEAVSYVPGLYPDSPDCLVGEEKLASAAGSLTVMTSRTETVRETVGYDVIEMPSRTLSVNTARTILEGENGTDQVTKVVTYADGRAVSSKEVSRSTLVAPVAMRRLVGTKVYSTPVAPVFATVRQLLWPVDGAYNINSDYSYRWGKFHYGLDIGVGSAPGTSLGMNVLAAADGVVELASTHSSYGYYIILDHGNGMETVYGHLMEDSFKVRPGETVVQGQPIARVGQTGYATGPHLHFEVRVNGNKVDPKLYLQQYKGIGY